MGSVLALQSEPHDPQSCVQFCSLMPFILSIIYPFGIFKILPQNREIVNVKKNQNSIFMLLKNKSDNTCSGSFFS